MQVKSPLKTKEDIAFEEMEKMILRNELPRGEFLSQRMLAGKVDTSLISVRGALRRLENEGLIENVPQWGVRIPVETKEQVEDRYYLREVLELAAVGRIIELSDASMADRLRAAAEACDKLSADEPENIEKFAQVHFDFHHLLAEASGSPALAAATDRLNRRSVMLHNAARGWGRGLDRAVHATYVETILGTDHAAAEEAVREHMQRGLAHELDAIGEE